VLECWTIQIKKMRVKGSTFSRGTVGATGHSGFCNSCNSYFLSRLVLNLGECHGGDVDAGGLIRA
jgi:hypothetical protein